MVEEVGGRTVVDVERVFWLMSSSVLPEKLKKTLFHTSKKQRFFPKRIVLEHARISSNLATILGGIIYVKFVNGFNY